MPLSLTPCIVGYLDLLGFSSGIMADECDPSHLMGRKIKFEALKRCCEKFIQSAVGDELFVRWQSDSCVVFCETDDADYDDLGEPLRKASTAMGIIQCQFACEDYFSRGGIAVGRMVLTGLREEPFGPGLTRAVEIEKKLAIAPRVVLSALLAMHAGGFLRVDDLKTYNTNRNMFVLDIGLPLVDAADYVDSEFLPFLDYLAFAEYIWPEMPSEVLAGHAEMVHNLVVAAATDPLLITKSRWLLHYHNWHIASRGGLERLIVKLPPPEVPEDNN